MFSMLHSSERPRALSNIKRTLKGSPLVARYFRGKALMEPMQKEDWQLVFIFFLQSSRLSSSRDKGSPDHENNCICKKKSVSPALNPDACFSSFLISVLCGIFFFQKRGILSTLKKKKTCSDRYPFSSVIILVASGCCL